MQTRLESLIEALLNIGSGFIVAFLTWQFIVAPLFGIPITFAENLGITSIFTAVSVVRSYIWRRLFNHRSIKRWQSSKFSA